MSDEWDAIRVLDEKENWIERTAVVSKTDHEHLVQCAKVRCNHSYHIMSRNVYNIIVMYRRY